MSPAALFNYLVQPEMVSALGYGPSCWSLLFDYQDKYFNPVLRMAVHHWGVFFAFSCIYWLDLVKIIQEEAVKTHVDMSDKPNQEF